MRKKTFKGTCVTHNRVDSKRKYLTKKEFATLLYRVKTCENIYPIPQTLDEILRVACWWYDLKRDQQGWHVSEDTYYLIFIADMDFLKRYEEGY